MQKNRVYRKRMRRLQKDLATWLPSSTARAERSITRYEIRERLWRICGDGLKSVPGPGKSPVSSVADI